MRWGARALRALARPAKAGLVGSNGGLREIVFPFLAPPMWRPWERLNPARSLRPAPRLRSALNKRNGRAWRSQDEVASLAGRHKEGEASAGSGGWRAVGGGAAVAAIGGTLGALDGCRDCARATDEARRPAD